MFTDLVTGDVPGAATYFNPLLRQSIIPCTSGARPGSPNDGTMIFETDTRLYRAWDAANSGWQRFGSIGRFSDAAQTLTATTTNPTIGTAGQATRRWWTFGPGSTCHFSFLLIFGSTGMNKGSGQYLVPLPVTSSGLFNGDGQAAMGAGMVRDSSSGTVQTAVTYIPTGVLTSVALNLTAGGAVTDLAPWTWAGGDYLAGSITYPI